MARRRGIAKFLLFFSVINIHGIRRCVARQKDEPQIDMILKKIIDVQTENAYILPVSSSDFPKRSPFATN